MVLPDSYIEAASQNEQCPASWGSDGMGSFLRGLSCEIFEFLHGTNSDRQTVRMRCLSKGIILDCAVLLLMVCTRTDQGSHVPLRYSDCTAIY